VHPNTYCPGKQKFMKNIYLVRHGESLANVDRAIHATIPDHKIPLSDRGMQQATDAGAELVTLLPQGINTRVRIWVSPYLRTRQTANQIAKELSNYFNNIDMREHINLCEQQFGLFDGIPDEELAMKASFGRECRSGSQGSMWRSECTKPLEHFTVMQKNTASKTSSSYATA
jgi:broad specificity phosphatase PhoE